MGNRQNNNINNNNNRENNNPIVQNINNNIVVPADNHNELPLAAGSKELLIDWDSKVVGQQEAKYALEYSFFLPRKFPKFFGLGNGRAADFSSHRAILLWGPPGTGKTLLADALAKAHGAKLEKLEPGNILSKWVGETEGKLKDIFEKAKTEKTIIFIDEIDSFGRARQADEKDWQRTQKTQLLQSIDDFLKNMQVDSALVACTNTLNELDLALQRRFKLTIFCGLPNKEERIKLLKFYCRKLDNKLVEADFLDISEKTDLYSGSDISRLVDNAKMGPFIELQSATHFVKDDNDCWRVADPAEQNAIQMKLKDIADDKLSSKRPVSKDDFIRAINRTKATISKKEYDRYLQLLNDNEKDVVKQIDEVNQFTSFEKEIIGVFSDDNSEDSFNYFKQLQRYMVVLSKPDSELKKINGNSLIVTTLILTLLALIAPSLLWWVLSLLCALILCSTVFIPLVIIAREAYTHQQTTINSFLMSSSEQAVAIIIFVLVISSDIPFFQYSRVKFVNDLVGTYFLNVITQQMWFVMNFIIHKINTNTKKIIAKYRQVKHLQSLQEFNNH